MVETRPPPFFIGDDLALDFLNSVAAPWGAEIEWLTDGSDLLTWLGRARAVRDEELAQARQRWSAQALDVVAEQARALREWFRAFVGDYAGAPVGPEAEPLLTPLNSLLRQDDAYRQIEAEIDHQAGVADRPGLRWRDERRWREPSTLLLPIAHAMGELACEKDFTLVRQCEGPTCTMWFYDVSKAHARRWCTMAVCGNRAKAAAHRARARNIKSSN